jgi:uroporphyrinogen decarboxylase
VNKIESIKGILKNKNVERIGICELFWSDALKEYTQQGHMKPSESYEDHFDLDIQKFRPFNLTLDLDFKDQVIEETDETVMVKDGNGAILRRHKLHNATPEHVDFTVQEKEDWDKVKHFLQNPADYERRIDFEGYRKAKEAAAKAGRFFCLEDFGPFALMHPVSGHEYCLMGMALEPEWVTEMSMLYTDTLIRLQEILFEREGYPDGIWYCDDLGFKERCFMSPDMYREIIFPTHEKLVDHAHGLDMPVILHSCGFIEPLLPHVVETGFDCLQAMEVKAGMDLLRIYNNFGDRIALMGGIDVRVIMTNDRQQIDAELMSKIPIVKNGYGYILHSDHSIPKEVNYDTLNYYFQKGIELGTY